MESNVPMDRLLCGMSVWEDGGCLPRGDEMHADGKQVAFLVPTTVLARQHYMTALHRFRGIPVKIAALSRFLSASETKETLRKLKTAQ